MPNITQSKGLSAFKSTSSFGSAYPLTDRPEEAIDARRKVLSWKTGFYHIAVGAHVPIVLGYLDYRRKVGGIGPVVHPSGNMGADMKTIQDFYVDISGKYPKNALSAHALAE